MRPGRACSSPQPAGTVAEDGGQAEVEGGGVGAGVDQRVVVGLAEVAGDAAAEVDGGIDGVAVAHGGQVAGAVDGLDQLVDEGLQRRRSGRG